MAHMLPLNEMTIEEKLQMMEAPWDDLSPNAPDRATPHWHGEILAQREDALERGQDQIEDWHQAREKIEKDIR